MIAPTPGIKPNSTGTYGSSLRIFHRHQVKCICSTPQPFGPDYNRRPVLAEDRAVARREGFGLTSKTGRRT